MSDSPPESSGQKFLKICGHVGTIATMVAIVMGAILYLLSMPSWVLGFCAGVICLGMSMAVIAHTFVSNADSFSTIGDWRQGYVMSITPLPEGEEAQHVIKGEPNTASKVGMVCLNVYEILFEFEGNTPIKVNKRGSKTFDGAIAEFVNGPNEQGWDLGVAFLEAQTTFLDRDGAFCHRVAECWWLGEGGSYIERLKPGARARLIIAFQMDDRVLAAEQPTGELYSLVKDFYKVQVRLSHGKSTFEFEFTPRPLKLEKAGLKASLQSNSPLPKDRLEIAQKLTEYMEEGTALLHTEADSEWWAAIVKTYIAETIGEFEAVEWSKPYPMDAWPRGAINRQRVDRTYTLLQRLGEVVTKLGKT